MRHRPYRIAIALLLALSSCRRERTRPTPTSRPTPAGPNALVPGAANPSLQAVRYGVVEGRVKPPPGKPGGDDSRTPMRPEWYPNGQPGNPYPPGVMIPINPPTPGMQPVPMQPGMVPIPGPGQQPYPALQPLPGQPTMQPIPAPGQQPIPALQPLPGQPTMQPIPAPSGTGPANPGGAARTLTGTLGPEGARDAEGRLQREHVIALRRGQRVIATLQSTAFDTMLRVDPPAGESMENDDIAPNDTNSRLDFTAPIDGRYRFVVSAYEPGGAGPYTLQVTAGEPGQGMVVTGGDTPGPDAQHGPGGTLTSEAPVSEYLSPADPSSGGRYVRAYRLEGRQGDMVTLRLESSAFDPTLTVLSPTGQRWFNDDTTQADTNSTVQVTIPATGVYRVEVSSYRQGATGPFSLTLRSSQAPVVGPGGAPTGNVAGRQGSGNMYGIFVGITDYGGSNNLYGCADDVRQLAQAYLNAHLAGAQQFVVLTDAEATTGAVRQAFAQMAGRVGPSDVFMFFHSGHGNRHASRDRSADPDGYVETIVLRDGEINAHEMSQLFDTVRADVNMLALDSCYSGGFERAFNSAPNRFGMYSSEEDVLSQVAQRFQSGGYLSYFLRRGVTEADRNRDASMRAGELAQYLIDQYAQNRASMQSEDGAGVETWQNVRVNRGGVAVNDLLWRFPSGARGFAAAQ